ncbi:hypothetical protein G9A89_000757 [Geosiphon pyriformis]|nr:hypothetical protein G9A89_000757 [Geosiphon pyriformis]
MSRTAKATLGVSIVATATTVWGVHYMQIKEKELMHASIAHEEELERQQALSSKRLPSENHKKFERNKKELEEQILLRENRMSRLDLEQEPRKYIFLDVLDNCGPNSQFLDIFLLSSLLHKFPDLVNELKSGFNYEKAKRIGTLPRNFFERSFFNIQHDKFKPFLFNYETTVSSSIAVLNKSIIESSFNIGVKSAKSRKKRRDGVLVDNIGNRKFAIVKMSSDHSWRSKTGNTIESNSVNMEEECLVEKTSFDYDKDGTFAGKNLDHTPKNSKILTKKALSKPLRKINFLGNNDDNILLNKPVVLPSPLKNLVNVSVCKFFALDIGLDKVVDKSSHKKCTESKILGGPLLPQNSLRSSEQHLLSNWAAGAKIIAVVIKEIPIGTMAEAVHAALSKFGIIKSIKMQLVGLWQKTVVEFEQMNHANLVAAEWSILIGKDAVYVAKAALDKKMWDVKDQHRALLYTLSIETNTYDIWDFVRAVNGKTCVINHYLIMYAWARCAVICFDFVESLDAIMRTTLVLRSANLYWFCLVLAECAKCKKLGYISLGCAASGKVLSGIPSHRVLLDMDKSRLAAIYAKHSALVAHFVSFGGLFWAKIAGGSSFSSLSGHSVSVKIGSSLEMKPSLLVTMEVNDRFATLEYSLTSLMEKVDKLAKRLDAFGPMVSQSSPGCQPLVISLSQNQGTDVVMSESLGVFTSGETIAEVVSFNMFSVSKLEDSIKCLIETVLGLSAKVNSLDAVWRVVTCNVKEMNNPAKQNNIIYWHKNINNLISIVTETKLNDKIHPWIMNKFSSIQVFTSGLDSGHMGSDVTIIINISLAQHVCKISKVPDWLLSVKLLFKNKFSVSILGLYAGASSVVWFFQTGDINSSIAKTVNKSSFIILGEDFNENGLWKCASFKKYLNLGLVNSLVGISSNLVNAVLDCSIMDVSKHFDTDHQAISVLVGLGGLLNIQLNSFHKQANKNHWKFDFKKNFKNATSVNAGMFSDEFATAVKFSDLDAMWNVLHRIITLLANEIFRKKWFKNFDSVFTKVSSKFHRLELLVSKIIKAFRERNNVGFDLIDSGVNFNRVYFALFGIRKSYCAFKLAKSLAAKEANIRSAINRRMESFEINKSHTIRNVLECFFCKVVLDHLVVNNELILESNSVKSKINIIMEEWTRKYSMVADVFDVWFCQYWPLDYVFNEAFSAVDMIFDLPDGKAAGLLEGVLTNICPIALIKMAYKILFKILFNRISLACGTFDVLCGNNFLVLKGTTIQSLIFAIGSVVENALEKNWKLWLVLQDMRKAYDSVSWEHLEKSLVRIKMCGRFIWFFGSIYKNCTNRVMTDFGLTDSYCVHDNLDQEEVFSPLLWHIFYDPLLCKVKRQESMYGYRLSSYFISRNGCAKSWARLSSFFAADTFIKDISINNNKTVAIPINSRVSISSLSISGLPISIAKKCESHQYLGIFLLTEGFSKPSLMKANSDIYFFNNLFSFVPISMCNKWDALIHKSLKFKSGLSFNFSSDTIHHSFFYGLKSFFQVQSESKVASFISFANLGDVLDCLFSYKSHNLQVLCWYPVHPLSSPVYIRVNAFNNFLADMVHIFLDYNLSLGGFLANLFWFCGGVPMSAVLDKSQFLRFFFLSDDMVLSLWINFVIIVLSIAFLDGRGFSLTHPSVLNNVSSFNILESSNFVSVCNHLLQVGANSLLVYTDKSLSNLGTVGCRASTATFFEDIDLGLGIGMSGLMSFTLAGLQTIALALECVPLLSSIKLFLDSQSALNACKSEVNLVCLDFRNQCWVKHHHIVNIIYSKNLKVSWHKIKSHFGVSVNEHADTIASNTSFSSWYLLSCLDKHFIIANGGVISGNSRHFVGSDSKFLAGSLLSKALHHWLPVVIRKCLYNRLYPSVLCLYYGDVEASDHVFSYKIDDFVRCQLLESHVDSWKAVFGFSHSSLDILQLLSLCVFNSFLSIALYKGFIFKDWFHKVVTIFHNPKVVGLEIVKFVHSLICAKHCAYMEKNVLISLDGSVLVLVSGLVLGLSTGVVKLLGITNVFGVCFGFHKSCLFFSGISNSVSVYIAV